MTNNVNITPNHLVLTGDVHVASWFGEIKRITHVHPGGHPALRIEFANHVLLELSLATAADACRRFGAALAFPPDLPDCSGIAADLEGGA